MTVYSVEEKLPEAGRGVLAWEAALSDWCKAFYREAYAYDAAEWILMPHISWLTPVITHWCELPPDPTAAE
jgi:hypothetical protein